MDVASCVLRLQASMAPVESVLDRNRIALILYGKADCGFALWYAATAIIALRRPTAAGSDALSAIGRRSVLNPLSESRVEIIGETRSSSGIYQHTMQWLA